jgi:hypothetical protein
MKVCALEVTRDSTVCRADRRFVRRPAQKRDSPKPTSYTAPLPATLPRSRARCCREAAESTSLAAFSHGLERGKSACRMVHLYPAPLHVVCVIPAQKSSDGLLAALRDHLCKMLDTDFREHAFQAVSTLENGCGRHLGPA